MIITNLPGNRLLIDIFGKLVYLWSVRETRTCAYSPIYIFLCKALVTLQILGQISYHFDDSRTLQYTPILQYMLDDQPFLKLFTTFLSQCNRMTITGL